MSVYLIVELVYSDQSWREEYRRGVPSLVTAYGGRYLALATPPELMEGERKAPDTLAVFDFPTAEAVRTFLACPEYQPYAEARRAGAKTQIYMLEALPSPA
ncbi:MULTISPECIES: DUF1330 domain-containing protein [Sphingobium]|uniref:DUF1330 domain-containing protein n=1 Tax=Sphingobium sp. MI1205 TaxID=407020 RepID=UPI00076FEABE|nr:DUF1330 domain-containing protein [Sphingobium sp. MI1205]AMK19782.1 hypothetical protein K663_17106 [Sphingobium sp. MI1205]